MHYILTLYAKNENSHICQDKLINTVSDQQMVQNKGQIIFSI